MNDDAPRDRLVIAVGSVIALRSDGREAEIARNRDARVPTAGDLMERRRRHGGRAAVVPKDRRNEHETADEARRQADGDDAGPVLIEE